MGTLPLRTNDIPSRAKITCTLNFQFHRCWNRRALPNAMLSAIQRVAANKKCSFFSLADTYTPARMAHTNIACEGGRDRMSLRNGVHVIFARDGPQGKDVRVLEMTTFSASVHAYMSRIHICVCVCVCVCACVCVSAALASRPANRLGFPMIPMIPL